MLQLLVFTFRAGQLHKRQFNNAMSFINRVKHNMMALLMQPGKHGRPDACRARCAVFAESKDNVQLLPAWARHTVLSVERCHGNSRHAGW